MPYLDLTAFRSLSVMPDNDIMALESNSPSFLTGQFAAVSSYIDSRLSKRYATPFQAPYPVAVQRWAVHLVTRLAFLKLGVRPTDEQFVTIAELAAQTETELREAADSNAGLFDLPLRQDTTATGIARGGPVSYTERSPYVWQTRQAERGREDDERGGGTYG